MDRSMLIERLRMQEYAVPADQDYVLSQFTPHDALGVSRLTCAIYGDQHPFDYVYDPAEVARLFASGSQYAIIARSAEGCVLGMIGIYRCGPWPRLFELAQLMILSNQRGKGMAMDLWRQAMATLPGVAGAGVIFGEAVCTHTFSQQMCQESGMLPCGIVLDAIPSKAYDTRNTGKPRTSLLLTAKPLDRQTLPAALPQWCRDEYSTMCRAMSLDRTLLPIGPEALAQHSEVDVTHYARVGCVKLLVRRAGPDLEELAVQGERDAGAEGIVQAAFDLSEPSAQAGIELLRTRGYFFGGFLPCWFGHSDGLLLQRRRVQPCFDDLTLLNDAPAYLVGLARRDAAAAATRTAAWGEP
ncbi:MAG: hypothetical protein AB9900_00515 [Humidesulfovibrio sp.]